MSKGLGYVLLCQTILHWKKVAVVGVAAIAGGGYYVGKTLNAPQQPLTEEAALQASFNTRAREGFADLGIKLATEKLVFTKTPSCGAEKPYGADYTGTLSGKDIAGTICMSKERQGRITIDAAAAKPSAP